MRALVKQEAGPGLDLVERPRPTVGPDDVLIRVVRAGLCGTDLHLEQWDDWAASTVTAPLTLGHEFYGEVVEVGADVTSVSVGQQASGEGHIVCGTCRNCRAGRRHMCIHTSGIGVNRDGAFADFVVIPAANVWVQPDDLDPDLGAVFDPLGNAIHTALSFPIAGEDVLITGAGPIGVMAAALARHVGARHVVVTDISDYRLELARQAGADLVVNVSRTSVCATPMDTARHEGGLRRRPGDVAAARSAVEDMLANLNHGGRVAMLGLPKDPFAIDWGRVITHMITIKGIYGREMYDTWYAMSSMLQTRASGCATASPRSSPTASRPSSGRTRSPRPARASAARSSWTGAEPPRPPAPREPSREEHHDVRTVQGRAEHHAAGDRGRRSLQARARSSPHPSRPTSRRPRPEALNFCANNYLGLADHPTVVDAPPRRRCRSGASGWPACASSAARRSCTRSSSARLSDFLGTEDDDPLLLLLRRQRRRLRDAVRRRRRDHLRRAQPRLAHRRHPAVQGPPAAATATPTWPTSRRSSSPPRTRAAASSSPTASSPWTATSPRWTRSATWPSGTTRWSWSTTRTPSASSARAAAAPRSASGSWTASTSSPAPSARRSAAPRAATSSAHREIVDLLRQRSRPYLFSNAVAPTVAAGSLRRARAGRRGSDDARAQLRDNTALFRCADDRGRVRPAARRSHPITPVMFPGEDGARQAAAIADAMLDDGVYVIAFSYPGRAPRARRGSACSCRPRTPRRTYGGASRRSSRPGTRWPDRAGPSAPVAGPAGRLRARPGRLRAQTGRTRRRRPPRGRSVT